ncbi:MAG TPA: hypothetical protein VG734_21755 [Lacunisphaera sp.]|nr:hypothetical protein [Lacunisphaera sp.]
MASLGTTTTTPAWLKDKLKNRLELVCIRIIQGEATARNSAVWLHRYLGVTSIVTSSAGSFGIIMTRATNEWPFVVSSTTVVMGVLTQIADHLGVAKQATDCESVLQLSRQYKVQLEEMLTESDPQDAIAGLVTTTGKLLDRYRVIPDETAVMKETAARWANDLVAKYGSHWKLTVRKQRPRKEAPQKDGEPDPTE